MTTLPTDPHTAVSATPLSLPDRQHLLHQTLQQPGELKSMKTTLIARPGNCYDNAVTESFLVP